MAEVVQDAQQDFWRPPVALEDDSEILLPPVPPAMAEMCSHCQTEFMIGSRFCHTCGAHRPEKKAGRTASEGMAAGYFVAASHLVVGKLAWTQSAAVGFYKRLSFPAWLRHLHFHEIKSWIGLPTPSLIAFMIGMGCVVGAVGVSLFYKASNLAEFQAIQMWRIEWLLAATASFVAGILLKKPSRD